MKIISRICALAACVAIVTAGALHADVPPQSKPPAADAKPVAAPAKGDADRAVVAAQKFSYPLTACPLSGHELKPGHCVDVVVQNRLVRVCCNDCKAEIEKDPTAAFKKIDAAVIAAQKPDYPLMVCAVTGAKLDDKAVDCVIGTRLVRVSNPEAAEKLERDPSAAMAKVDEAYIKIQLASYPLKTCPISGEELGGMGDSVSKLYGTMLVRFCCNDCVKTFEKSPDEALKKLAAARAAAK